MNDAMKNGMVKRFAMYLLDPNTPQHGCGCSSSVQPLHYYLSDPANMYNIDGSKFKIEKKKMETGDPTSLKMFKTVPPGRYVEVATTLPVLGEHSVSAVWLRPAQQS